MDASCLFFFQPVHLTSCKKTARSSDKLSVQVDKLQLSEQTTEEFHFSHAGFYAESIQRLSY